MKIVLIILLGVIIFKIYFVFLEQKSLYHPYGEILFKSVAEPKQFFYFDGGHNDDVYVTSVVYRKDLRKILSVNAFFHSYQ